MSKKRNIYAVVLFAVGILFLLIAHLHNHGVAVLQPSGIIGQKERHLMIIALLLSLIVIVPVFAMLIGFSWKYREGNKTAKYQPDFSHSRLLESIWWGVPLAIISVLGVITWNSSRELDPFRSLSSTVKPMTVQVIALQWKWLFIYPKQNFATLNFLEIPVNTPVKFEITSDAPMNSFWIPKLGGQIYAMSGMATNLNLEASQTGDFEGLSANISGKGFAAMHFKARVADPIAFAQWESSKNSGSLMLSPEVYRKLSVPSIGAPHTYFSSVQDGLFDSVVNKYLSPGGSI